MNVVRLGTCTNKNNRAARVLYLSAGGGDADEDGVAYTWHFGS